MVSPFFVALSWFSTGASRWNIINSDNSWLRRHGSLLSRMKTFQLPCKIQRKPFFTLAVCSLSVRNSFCDDSPRLIYSSSVVEECGKKYDCDLGLTGLPDIVMIIIIMFFSMSPNFEKKKKKKTWRACWFWSVRPFNCSNYASLSISYLAIITSRLFLC